ncbi:MAG: APC family permease [Pyrinomonadaceae bacterium]
MNREAFGPDIHSSASIEIAEVLPASRKLGLLPLTAVIFFTVCGGAFGIEPLVGKVGAGWAILLIVVTPLMWSVPISLMVSELASAMPVEGGYYVWVKRALGSFWGFQEGWWTCLYTSVDMAIYPVLFVNYLAYFVPFLRPDANGDLSWEQFFSRWAIAAGLIAFALALNWRGARAVGYNSVAFLLVIVVPFAILSYLGLASLVGGLDASWRAVASGFGTSHVNAGLLAVGLATVVWNYSGWDNVSTFAGEVRDASRSYPRALFAAMGLAVLVYLIPTFALVGHTTDAGVWNESAGFPALAEMVGGPALGTLIAMAALFSAWSLFNSQILYASRLPYAMARDGWFPGFLTRVNVTTGVPTTALLVCCGLSALFAALPFGKLVVIDVILYSAEVLLEFVALMVLRRKEPDLPRPFKIAGGWPVLVLITAAPTAFAAAVVWATLSDAETDPRHLWVLAAGLVSGVLLYFVRRGKAGSAA